MKKMDRQPNASASFQYLMGALLAFVVSAAWAQSKPHAHHKAHAHGQGELELAIEQGRLQGTLRVPRRACLALSTHPRQTLNGHRLQPCESCSRTRAILWPRRWLRPVRSRRWLRNRLCSRGQSRAATVNWTMSLAGTVSNPINSPALGCQSLPATSGSSS